MSRCAHCNNTFQAALPDERWCDACKMLMPDGRKCGNCGVVERPHHMPADIRHWICRECRTVHDRETAACYCAQKDKW